NIVGQDIGETPGFASLALNMAYRTTRNATLTAGVDNVFNTRYAEHLSRADAVDGLPVNSRVYEPGRFLWARLTVNFN
ncbi:MAG: TonB-dependent receptor, partial [Sulfuricella sp.]|nr:TonB-dependent receptor [Sulfuricella sp.]